MIRILTSTSGTYSRKMSSISSALHNVLEKMETATSKRNKAVKEEMAVTPRLVAVSKTKPVSSIVEAYRSGQRHFGENYVNELSQKSSDPEILAECEDIRWHFIGHLQRNKSGVLISCPNLYMVETVESIKIANTLNKQWESRNKQGKLRVMVQVNTSMEDNKHGCNEEEMASVVKEIKENCPHLEFAGLMTIGSFNHDITKGPNPDFLKLSRCRDKVCQELQLEEQEVELSMGMSGDYEHAIELGSTNVRIGSTIFGAREPKNPNVTKDNPDSQVNSGSGSKSNTSNTDNSQGNAESVLKAGEKLCQMSIGTSV
ncbi:pyridoxal phosphate homeostasis protein-like [Ostrea edulis]|uniref:pyridoxal phosphate homeostasis protein-like n=1 Tax=Ostrea edulis TaxID=37623 RepID=UPI0024AE92EF|nr:pyridoxal phosphate homeostasis protein-like [Ostrea edulis]